MRATGTRTEEDHSLNLLLQGDDFPQKTPKYGIIGAGDGEIYLPMPLWISLVTHAPILPILIPYV